MVAQSCSTLLRPQRLEPARLLHPWDFPGQEYWRGWPFPFPGNLPNEGIEPTSPALTSGVFTTELPRKPQINYTFIKKNFFKAKTNSNNKDFECFLIPGIPRRPRQDGRCPLAVQLRPGFQMKKCWEESRTELQDRVMGAAVGWNRWVGGLLWSGCWERSFQGWRGHG